MTVVLLLMAAGFAGGALNAVAGGGSFVGFPALIAAGVPPIQANATTTFVMWPGTLSSIAAYRDELREGMPRSWALAGASLIGGGLGAWLLLSISPDAFSQAVPALMLVAASTFTWGGRIGDRLRRRASNGAVTISRPVVLAQLGLAIYGGFFGAGLGIMMLSLLLLAGMRDMHRLNAAKAVLGALANITSLVAFVAADIIVWRRAIVMAVAATIGGYVGARLARRCPPQAIRRLVLVIAWSMTGYFTWQTYVCP